MPATSSSTATDGSTGWEDIVRLGRQLIEQLGDAGTDIALCWMAHHVARLITEAEAARGEDIEPAQERCRRAIIDLWKARHAIFHRVPLASTEAVGAAVHALQNGNGWFFNRMRSDEEGAAVPRAIELARGVDQSARAILRAMIGQAVREGVVEEREWLWLTHTRLPDLAPVIVLFEEAIVTSPQLEQEPAVEPEAEAIAAEAALRAEREALVEKLRVLSSVADEIAAYLLP